MTMPNHVVRRVAIVRLLQAELPSCSSPSTSWQIPVHFSHPVHLPCHRTRPLSPQSQSGGAQPPTPAPLFSSFFSPPPCQSPWDTALTSLSFLSNLWWLPFLRVRFCTLCLAFTAARPQLTAWLGTSPLVRVGRAEFDLLKLVFLSHTTHTTHSLHFLDCNFLFPLFLLRGRPFAY